MAAGCAQRADSKRAAVSTATAIAAGSVVAVGQLLSWSDGSSAFSSGVLPHAGSHAVQSASLKATASRRAQNHSVVGETAVVAAGLLALGVTAALPARRRRKLGRRLKTACQQQQPLELKKVDRSTTKAFFKELTISDQYFRFSKSEMETAMEDLKSKSGSELVSQIRQNGNRLTIGNVTFVLAESLGFCWGVERTLAMAYEARRHFAGKRIWITNEIIHNADVNKTMDEMKMQFVPKTENGVKDFSNVQEGDVVILPAFGASVDEMALLKERNVQIVDTTCPWVSKVWRSIERSKEKGYTSIIHGKSQHEETIASTSFAETYLVVKNLSEAEYVANYILGEGSRDDFMHTFKGHMSEGFDPDVDLDCVSVANQTTMLKGETELIGRLFERVMIRKYGPHAVNEHFLAFNTICDATQERQDAMYKMLNATYEAPVSALYADLEGEQVGIQLQSEKQTKKKKDVPSDGKNAGAEPLGAKGVDLCLIVGGFNSSNTSHLIEIPEELGVPSFHIDCAARIGGQKATNVIQHKPLATSPADAMLDRGLAVTEGFLPDGPLVIAVTAGASTPDGSIGACLQRLLAIRGIA